MTSGTSAANPRGTANCDRTVPGIPCALERADIAALSDKGYQDAEGPVVTLAGTAADPMQDAPTSELGVGTLAGIA